MSATETGRIRWEPNADGDVLMGYIGSRPGIAFRIYAPDHQNCQWLLSVRLVADAKFIYASDRDEAKAIPELKNRAERWLEEFTSSLGAIFGVPDCSAVTRFETIDHTRGLASISQVSTRAVVAYGASVELSFQDGGQTLKVILTDPAKEAAQ